MKNIKFLTLMSILLLLSNLSPIYAANLLAFPGAEGFGRYAAGGRGGTIYHVTNLNDSGTGSFRDAISSPNRIIVFDISGIIKVTAGNPLIFSKNLTILGQTAPGEGVQVYGERVSFSGSDNIIVRFMRIRMGVGGTSGKDAAGVANGKNMIFDHMSVLWGRDETFSVNWDSKGSEPANITIQNSIIGQGLQTHSCGGLIQTDGGVTLFRNLYIENKTRNPKVKGLNQYVNNVVYNWGNGGCYIMGDTEADSWAHIENNYFINGPWEGASGVFSRGTPTFTYYGDGNYYDGDQDGILDGTLMTSDQYSGSTAIKNFDTWDNSTTRPQAHPVIKSMMSAKDALAWIIDSVGPSLPIRDEVDAYIIDEVKSYGKKGTTGGITTEKTLPHGGTGILYGGYKPKDSDGDAIPDSWENANGLNPDNSADAAEIAANGYANIENYANSIVTNYPYIKSPSGIKSTAATTSEINLSWTDNSSDETGFVLEMSTDGSTYTVIETLPANTNTYKKTGLSKETVYYFRVKAINTALYSPYSNVISVKTLGDPTVPVACTDPNPNNEGTFGISNVPKFSWSNATNIYGGTIYYTLYFGLSPETMKLVKDSITTSYYTIDTTKTGSLKVDTTYYWRVDARNTMGKTTGSVWSFNTVSGGTLFATDFHYTPVTFYDAYGKNTVNTDIFSTSATANSTKTYSGMVLGNGPNQVRIVWLPQGAPTSTTSDYGPYTEADAGSTAGCIQFVTEKSGGYVKFPEVQGPCVITFWTGNTSASSRTFNLKNIIGGTESTAASFTMAAAKRSFKFKYTYTGSEKVIFKIDANGKKINVNDAVIEAFIPDVSPDPIAFTSAPDSLGVSYADGSMSFTLNQSIKYNGGATINGDQFEQISVSGSGSSINVSYIGLDAGTRYTIAFPSGSLTDFYGTKTNDVEFSFTTCDFPAAKIAGETHFGKAAKTLPLNFKPFNITAPFKTTGDSVQSKYADYPHWISATGGITADSVLMTSTSDKIMSYFNDRSGNMHLKAMFSGTSVVLKVQETKNPDISPGWRTIRQFSATDFPIDEDFALNSETRFTKIVPVSISGSVIIKDFQISDANGNYATGLTEAYKDLGIKTFSSAGRLMITGIRAGMSVEIFDVTGKSIIRRFANDDKIDFGLQKGFYIIRITEGNITQLIKAKV
jgi:hypothetical protein